MSKMPYDESEHPGHRAWEPEDPMQLDAVPAAGDPGVMLDCLVEEFARLGMTASEIEELFERPHFQATHGLSRMFEPETLSRRIREVSRRAGVLKFNVTETTPANCPPDLECTPGPKDPEGRT